MDSYKAAEGWKEFSNMKSLPFFVNNLRYFVTDAGNKKVEVIGYETEPEGKLEIPATVNFNGADYSVSSIGKSTFYLCTKLTEVIIGKNVANIGNDAFNGCNTLKEITFALVDHNIPVYVPAEAMDSYKAAEGWKEFSNMKAIPFFAENLKYSIADASNKTVNVIGYQTEPEGKVEIPATVNLNGTDYKVTGIGDQAFHFCTKLTEVVIGKNVMNIGNDAFNSCNVLEEITVEATVPPTVGNQAFALVDHNIPVYVPAEAMDNYKAAEGWKEFSNMKAKFAVDNLWYIITDAGNKTVELVGYETKPEGKLEIPAAVNHNSTDYSVVRIGDKAFQLCTKLTEVTIGKNVTDIGNSAFFVCNELEKITVQATVPPTVGKEAFEYVNENVSVYVPAEALGSYKITEGWRDFTNLKSIPFTVDNLKYSITDVSNKTVELIGYETKPEGKLEIPATVNINGTDYSVTRIGDKAFYGCDMITEMNVKATVPPAVGKEAFENVDRDIPVYVPAEAMDSYKAAEGWRDFTNLKNPATTGLHRSTLPESISVNNGTLHNPQGLAVSIYDLKGRLVYSGKGISISLPAGMYVVRCAGANSKVIF